MNGRNREEVTQAPQMMLCAVLLREWKESAEDKQNPRISK